MMKKNIKKVAVMCALGAAVCVAVTNYAANRESEDGMLLANVEALSDGESSNQYYLHHFQDCKFHVASEAQVTLFTLLGFQASVGADIDISCMTQYFNNIKGEDGEGPCSNGNQVTCYDAIQAILD